MELLLAPPCNSPEHPGTGLRPGSCPLLSLFPTCPGPRELSWQALPQSWRAQWPWKHGRKQQGPKGDLLEDLHLALGVFPWGIPGRGDPQGQKIWVLQFWWAKPRGLRKGYGDPGPLSRQTCQTGKTGRHHLEATAPVHHLAAHSHSHRKKKAMCPGSQRSDVLSSVRVKGHSPAFLLPGPRDK